MRYKRYNCPKCNHRLYDIGEIRTTGGFWTKIFNIQTKRFTSVTCQKCFYTEFYRVSSRKIGDVLDFFTN